MLSRLFLFGDERPGVGRRIANLINSQAHKAIFGLDNDAGFISHAEVIPTTRFGLFRSDGVHLREEGMIVLRMNRAEALIYFNCHPGAKVFQPS